MNRLAVSLPGLDLKNPIMPASGTFGFGEIYREKIDYNQLGTIVLKSATLEARRGNPEPRYDHLPYGTVLNSVGIKNPGVDALLKDYIPQLGQYDTPVIASVAGSTVEDYIETAKRLAASPVIRALEINVSCPNVKAGGFSFGVDPAKVQEITAKIKAVTSLPLYVKLTPNVTDIVSIAKAAEAGGADGLSMINTLLGMHIDVATGKPVLGGITGGQSGPGIKPVAIRMVYQVAQAVSIPIIGMGGLSTVDDVLEMLMAGASAVMIGTANYEDPDTMIRIIKALPKRMDELQIDTIAGLTREILAERRNILQPQ